MLTLLIMTAKAQSPMLPQTHAAMLTSPNGPTTVTVSLEATAPITPIISFNVSRTLPTRLSALSKVFAVEGKGFPATHPVTLTILYNPPAGVDEGKLTLTYYDALADKWLPLSTTIDPLNHVATALVALPGQFALVWLPAANPLPPSAVIVDDLDTSKFKRYGDEQGWHAVAGSIEHYYLGHMYWTSNTRTVLDNYAVWTPTLSAGPYQVYAFVPWNNATTQQARYQIVHQGQTAVYTMNQNSYYAEWVSLGTYDFGNAPGSNYVRLEDVTGETYLSRRVGFDAVGFVPPFKVYLPLVLRNWPPPPPPKWWSGMHMGNINSRDWGDDMLAPFDPDKNGAWPKIATVLSHQVFSVVRDPVTCRITDVTVRNSNLYNYLRKATLQGDTWVIFRIYPSPGNFEESIDPLWPDPKTRPSGRTLITEIDKLPGDGSVSQCDGYANDLFRTARDVGDEILAIQRYIAVNESPGSRWQAFGFEPANEPNVEWYSNPEGQEPNPAYYQPESWQAMDQYFANLYDYVHDNAGGLSIRVLTPPMAQNAYAEMRNVTTPWSPCDKFAFSGYEVMTRTFNSGSPKNDGYSWHNYWIKGREAWAGCPNGQHVSMWFPDIMSTTIRSRVAVITEADLAPPQLGMENPLTDKDAEPEGAAVSIRDFLYYEPGFTANRIAVWLLHDDNPDNVKHTWSQAYTPTVGFRAWFTQWWYQDEIP